MSSNSDDNETARYLASYIYQQLGTIPVGWKYDECLYCLNEEQLHQVIKEFYATLR